MSKISIILVIFVLSTFAKTTCKDISLNSSIGKSSIVEGVKVVSSDYNKDGFIDTLECKGNICTVKMRNKTFQFENTTGLPDYDSCADGCITFYESGTSFGEFQYFLYDEQYENWFYVKLIRYEKENGEVDIEDECLEKEKKRQSIDNQMYKQK